MVKSVYVKALAITLLLFAGNFMVIKYLDDSRGNELRAQLYSIQEDMQSSRVLLLYSQSRNDSASLCPLLANQTNQQVAELYELYGELTVAEEAHVFADTGPIKRVFILTNAELLLYLRQMESVCGYSLVEPVLYFYPDGADCLECRAQAKILNSLTQECPGVRVFAFPSNSDLPVIQAITEEYGITVNPSVVINEKVYPGVSTREELLGLVSC